MFTLSNSAVVLLEELLRTRQAQAFGSWFQDAVAVALGTLPQYAKCYANPGAGQPDILAGKTGFEVKTTSMGTVNLEGNYQAIRPHYPVFKLIGLRTDVRPFLLWVIEMPPVPPRSITFRAVMPQDTPVDHELGPILAQRLSSVLVAAGNSWISAPDRKEALVVLENMAKCLLWPDSTAA
ncbi:MAG: hypothetical protein ACKO3H_12315 [Verrucomicrobiota bacterium]